jgi:levansucrase
VDWANQYFLIQGRVVTASFWTPKHVASIAAAPIPSAPVIAAGDRYATVPGCDHWDYWPVQNPDGSVADIANGTLWMVLSAPALGNPIDRHLHARIRLMHEKSGQWTDLGFLLPIGLNPGNREWSGSAILTEPNKLTLYYTAAGQANTHGGWQQRLFETQATLSVTNGLPQLSGWSAPIESVKSDGSHYVIVDQLDGTPGAIKAFRDPAYFCDPADGTSYLLFAASLAQSSSSHNGCVGWARRSSEARTQWDLLPPLVIADSLNNELERPHILFKNDLYYLFWSTQNAVFAPDGPAGPTGLYGMVAETIAGPYTPLNGSGLVIANPASEPRQAYSWQVLDDLRVTSFTDYPNAGLEIFGPDDARAYFGGSLAPMLKIILDGTTTTLSSGAARP